MPSNKTSRTNILWQESVGDQWQLYAPPTRPSKSECAIWREHLAKKKHARTLVLGATPELRDISHSLKHDVTLIDVSLSMMQSMQRFMRVREPQETWVRANWITNPLQSAHFDFVIGDLVMGNVPFALQPKFLETVARVLKPRGYFIHRTFGGFPYSVQDTYKRFSRYAHTPLSPLHDNEICLDLLNTSWNPKTFACETTVVRQKIRRFLATCALGERKGMRFMRDRFNLLFCGEKMWWTSPREISERMMRKHFRIIARVSGNDHALTESMPIYILQKI
ncbi:MAG: class I SAM-dependent methyltransferase [bacterium]|nr:class I SAM-dependent methyltransferase [bacterium]